MSFLRVCANVSLQTRHHPLVRVVGHDAHQLHAPLNLRKGQEGRRETVSEQHRVSHPNAETAALWFNIDSPVVWENTTGHKAN